MKRLNLSEWAITHRALVLFMIILLGQVETLHGVLPVLRFIAFRWCGL